MIITYKCIYLLLHKKVTLLPGWCHWRSKRRSSGRC